MNMQNDNIIYWRKNQALIVVNTSSQLESDALLKPELDPIWSKIRTAFKDEMGNAEALPNVDLNLKQTIQHPSHRIYLVQWTPPVQAQVVSGGKDDTPFDVLRKLEGVKAKSEHDYSVIPNWLNSGVNNSSDDNTHGCPVSPPYPVKGLEGRGQHRIALPHLPDDVLRNATGKGVTVFVLDTLPSRDQIITASKKANERNILLKEMVDGMKDEAPYNAVPPAINLNYSFKGFIPDPQDSAKTGKDIYGRLVGFPMEDHGLAIAGILRDLAPHATIECIQVLNDYGVGDLHTLLLALNNILERIKNGSLKGPVVINMSLVWLPPEHDIHDGSLPSDINDFIATSKNVLYSILTQPGFDAIFVASAGNDSDPRDAQMNSTEVRFSSRYPAAFADDEKYRIDTMIPVGAVNKDQRAATYSNYPGQSGIATYGGELPKPHPWLPGAISHVKTQVDAAAIDAICGIYTAEAYPALSVNDDNGWPMGSNQMGNTQQGMPAEYPMYPAPDSHAWAYWSGTSYATPIISALVARAIESERARGSSNQGGRTIRDVIRNNSAEELKLWTRVVEYKDVNGSPLVTRPEDLDGKVIRAVQEWHP